LLISRRELNNFLTTLVHPFLSYSSSRLSLLILIVFFPIWFLPHTHNPLRSSSYFPLLIRCFVHFPFYVTSFQILYISLCRHCIPFPFDSVYSSCIYLSENFLLHLCLPIFLVSCSLYPPTVVHLLIRRIEALTSFYRPSNEKKENIQFWNGQ